MKTTKFVIALAAVLAGALATGNAFAHRSRVTFGLHFGVPIGGYYGGYYAPYPYYYPPYPYYAPTVVVPAQPQTYIEQGGPAPAPAQSYWYYCNDSRAYYPYVKDCPGGWQRVAPQPQN